MERKLYYEIPTQVKFICDDTNNYLGGIAFEDYIICGCCGATIPIEEVYANAEDLGTNLEPIITFDEWVDISENIKGDEFYGNF